MRLTHLLLPAALVACASSTGPAAMPGPNDVWMPGGNVFSPAAKSISAGTTVTFTDEDGITHTVTSSSVPMGASTFNTSVSPHGSTQLMLSTPGTYQYYCTIHGTPTSGMHGTITVN